MGIISDSAKFMRDFGVSSTNIHNASKMVESHVNRFYTPNILETSSKNQVLMSIFDRLASERILFVTGEVNDVMSTIVQAQLIYLDNIGDDEITLYVDSPGGSVKSGLTIYDAMNFINSDIVTVTSGMAASMGSIIASSGTQGKRHILKNAKFMLHKVSSGARGVIDDMQISFDEALKYNDILFDILAENTKKDKQQILTDCHRDFWLDSKESLDYQLVDNIIIKKSEL